MTRIVRFQRVCRAVFLLLMMIVFMRIAAAVVSPPSPLAASPIWGCDICELRRDIVVSSPPQLERRALDRSIVAHLGMPKVRSSLAAAQAIQLLPFLTVFFALAMAFRTMALGGLAGPALRWLRRSAFASIFLILADPVAQSIRWTVFSPVIHGREHLIVLADPTRMLWLILLSFAVWASVWIIEEAVVLRQDLEEYV